MGPVKHRLLTFYRIACCKSIIVSRPLFVARHEASRALHERHTEAILINEHSEKRQH